MATRQGPFRVLFLGGAKRISLAEHFVSAGRPRGLEVSVFSYELDGKVPISKVAKVIPGLRWSDPDLYSDLERVIQREGIDCIIPFVDPAIEVCARLAKRNANLFIPVCSMEVACRFYDKLEADSWFQQCGIPLPTECGRFPQIAKPRRGSASQGLKIFRELKERQDFFQSNSEKEYLVQTFIDGIEYTVDAYVSMHGEILSVVPRKRLEVNAGESMKSITCRHDGIDALSRRVLSEPGFRGPITLQFIEDRKDASLYMMEINPRFGGACLCSIHSGADSVGLMLDEFIGLTPQVITHWKPGFIMTRAYQEVYFHADHS